MAFEGDVVKTLEVIGKIVGIGGFAIVFALLIFRNVVRQKIFPTLTKQQGFILLVTIVSLTSIIACFGIGAWVIANIYEPNPLSTLKELGIEPTEERLIAEIRSNNIPVVEMF